MKMISLTAATAVCCYILLLIPFLLVNCKNVFVANNLPSLRESGNETELVNAARLSFRLNVSQVTNGRPFHATCNIDRWYGANQKDYIVHFYRTNGDNSDKELVGRHEIYAPTELFPNGRHLFTRADLSDVVISSGRHFTYPTFDLVGSPKSVSVDKVYWCELTDRSSGGGELTYLSNVWAGTPVLQLSITRLSGGTNNNRYLARCTVRHFHPNPARSAYTVQFSVYSTDYIFGSFIREAGGPTELELGTAYNRKSVGHGTYFDVPVFDLVFEVLGYTDQQYRCRLFDDSDDWDGWTYVTSNSLKSY